MDILEENSHLIVLAQKSEYCSNKRILFLFSSQVPSKPPEGIIAESHVTLTTIPVAWQPIDSSHIHGILLGYKIRYQAVAIGEEPVEDEPIREEIVSPSTFFLVLKNLEIFTLYRIDVMGYTIMGNGPPATDYAGWSNSQAYHTMSHRIEYTFKKWFRQTCLHQCCLQFSSYHDSLGKLHILPRNPLRVHNCELQNDSSLGLNCTCVATRMNQIGRICLFFTLFRRSILSLIQDLCNKARRAN